jgi:thioredoxin-like negative regulator of GroEL
MDTIWLFMTEPAPQDEGVLEADDRSFERLVEKSELPAVVMFFSPACPYCRSMEPYFRQYSSEFKGRMTFVRMNTEGGAWTAERYGVRSTPTFKVFCSGRPVSELVGAVYPAILKRALEEALLQGKECITHSTAIDYDISGYG